MIERLPAQLQMKLVLPKPGRQVAQGSFEIEDYAIEFVRFLDEDTFEFVLVARVCTSEERSFVAFVVQVSLSKGHRIVDILRATATNHSLQESRQRCSRLVTIRRKGFEKTVNILLTNHSVVAGESLSVVSNPRLPIEIIMSTPT